jgi:hypothetical protein
MSLRSEPTSFWARRKAAVQAEAEAERRAIAAAEQAAADQALAEAQAELTEEDLLAELGLKDPDTMQQGDDFSAFMQRAVPEALRRRALRRLWVSNPVLANLDGLIDHGEDYTDAATVVPGMKTAYQVGKGMLQHVTALAEQAEALAETAAGAAAGTTEEAPETVAAPAVVAAPMLAEPTEEAAPEVAEAPETPDTLPRARSRMRIAFAD